MRSKLTTGLLVVALLCAVGWNARSQNTAQTQVFFMYHVMDDPTQSGNREEGLKQLNKLGSEGWEIAGVSRGKDGPAVLYLKRRLL